MATYTPPPYFPQGSLAPPDKKRYQRFKLAMVVGGILLVVLIGGIGVGAWFLLKWVF